MILGPIQRWFALYRSEGLQPLLGHLRALLWSKRGYIQLEMRLGSVGASLCPHVDMPAGYELCSNSLPRLVQWRQWALKVRGWLPAECFMDEFAGLEQVYTVWRDSELAHICWVATPGKKGSLPGQIVADGEVEVRAAYTFPDYRGQGLFRSTLRMVVHKAGVAGAQRITAYVRPANVSSLRAFRAAGFQVRGICVALRCCGIPKISIRPIDDQCPLKKPVRTIASDI